VAEPFSPLVRDQRAALLGVLAHVEGEGWGLPTVCVPWTIKDVVAHLVEGELQSGRLYRGEISERDTDTHEGVGRWSRVDGETVRYSLWHHGEATQRVIDSRSDDSWGREVTDQGRAIELRGALRKQFFELTVHSHDVTEALGLASNWDGRALPLAEYCIERAPLALATVKAGGAVELEVDGLGVRTLHPSADGWSLKPEPAQSPAATWHTDPETLVLATTGRLDVQTAAARTKVEGDAGLIGAILEAWQLAR